MARRRKSSSTSGARLAQPRILGKPRLPLPSSVEDRIWSRVEATANRFGVSRSFVVAVALADSLGVVLDGRYRYDRKR